MNNIKTGKFISELRKDKNMTQKELADKLFVSDRAVSKWERGLSFPDISLIEKLAIILDVSISDVLKGEKIENMNKKQSDEIIKESIPFFKNKSLKKVITATVFTVIIGLFIGYLCVMWYGEIHYGEIIYKNGSSRTIPSFSGNVAKNNSKKFITALVKNDYNTIDTMLVSNIIASGKVFDETFDKEDIRYSNKYYIDNLKLLKDEGFKITKYKLQDCHPSGNNYTCVFDLELEYEKIKYSMNMYLDNYPKRVVLSGIGYNNDFTTLKYENSDLYYKIEKIFNF